MKECFVVLGMHRSGTSVLTGLLNILGCYAGVDLIMPCDDNPKGCFENLNIRNLNEKILIENDSSWDDSLFSINKIPELQLEKYVQLAKTIIIDDLKYASKIIINDPRVSLLFPIWEEALTSLNINIKIILIYRSPMEVALSLKQQNGMSVEKGLILWSQYFFQAEAASRPYQNKGRLLTIEYDNDFLEPNKLVKRLASFIELDALTDSHKKQATTLFKPSMKNQSIPLTNIASNLPNYLTSLIELLLNKKLDDSESIDQLHKEFNRSQDFFLYNKKQKDSAINEHQRNYESIKTTNNEQTVLIESHHNKLDKQHLTITSQQTKIRKQQTKLDKNHKLINAQLDTINQQKAAIQKLQATIDTNKKDFSHFFTLGRRFKESYEITDRASVEDKMRSEFDDAYYLFNNPDVMEELLDPFKHFTGSGWKEGRDPNPLFSVEYYLENNPDVRKSGINPLQHYAETGKKQHLQTMCFKSDIDIKTLLTMEFDTPYYLTHNPDVLSSKIDPFKHFMEVGWKEGRDPNAHFSTSFYLDCNPDVEKAGINPLEHYLLTGRKEHRTAKPLSQRKIKPPSSSPSILFVGHSAAQGGAEIVLLDIIRWYAENTGYQISILLLAPGLLASEFMRYGEVLTLNNADELASKKSKAFLSFYYDLIYLNTVVAGSFGDTYQRLYAKHNIPIVLHVHEMSKVINTFKDEFDSIVKNVDLFIAASTRVKEDLVDEFGIKANSISVHHSFVRSKAKDEASLNHQITAARETLDLDQDDVVIIGSGTVYWRKGPDIFVESLRQVIKQYADIEPNKNVVGIWLGDGEDLASLQALVEEKGLSDNIRFPGFLKNASELVAAADIFFLSSREDPFPLVCLEAAQFEIPIVCFEKATGIIEFIQNDAGISIPEIDVRLAADALIELIQDGRRRKQLGVTARTRFLQNYSSEPRIQNIFSELKKRYGFKSLVSAIIPSINHPDLQEQIDSILNQSFYDIEILCLYNVTKDKELVRVKEYAQDSRVLFVKSVVKNDINSTNTDTLWQKAVDLSKGDYIWITDSNSSCSNNFVEVLLEAFNDTKVVLSYCKTETSPDLEKFKAPYILDGNIEVEENFALDCTISTIGSAIFRKAAIENAGDILEEYTILGDWGLYLHALSQGKISYSTDTINDHNSVNASTVNIPEEIENTDLYFKERYEIASQVVNTFNISKPVLEQMIRDVDNQWNKQKHRGKEKSYKQLFNKQRLIKYHKQNYIPVLKIGFYVHGFLFSKGGIERLAADLANYLAHRGHQITIFCRVHSNNEPIFHIDNRIQIIPAFDETNIETSVIKLQRELRDQNLDIFIPMLSEWIFEPAIQAAEGLGLPIIASEHNSPKIIESKWWNHASRITTFEKVNQIHLLRKGYKQSLPQALQSKIKVIHNGSYLGKWIKPDSRKTYKRILSAGRLSPQKRFDRLIKAFSIASSSIDDDWVLDIYGEGPDGKDLAELISVSNMEERIFLNGNTNQLEKEYLTSDLFVLPSEFEGDPVVLIEAKMLGLPCIGYNNCAGTNEAIRHNVDGLLANPDEDGSELAKMIITLIQDTKLRNEFGDAAMAESKQFSMTNIASQWEKMIVTITSPELKH